MRVHILAKELNVTSKDILKKCQAEGIEVKNHMSTVGAGLEATVREWFSDGAHTTTVETTDRVDLTKVRKKRKAKKAASATHADESTQAVAVVDEAPPADAKAAETSTSPAETSTAETSAAETSTAETTATETSPAEVSSAEASPAETSVADVSASEKETATAPVDEVADAVLPIGDALVAETEELAPTDSAPASVTEEAALVAEAPETVVGAEVPSGDADDVTDDEKKTPQVMTTSFEAPEAEEAVAPAGPQNVPAPAKLSGPRVVRYEAPEEYAIPRRGPRRRPGVSEPAGPGSDPPAPGGDAPGARGRGTRGRPGDDARRGAGGGAGSRRGSGRRSGRDEPGRAPAAEWNNQDLAERRERLRGATGRRMVSRRATGRKGGASPQVTQITEAQIEEPIMLKQLCSAIGVPFQRMFPVLHREHNLMANLTTIVSKEVAELVALSFGVELKVVEAKTGLDRLREEHAALERKSPRSRPPIVTVLGHVDHGKTSLLDHIRRARVADREDGGITQHISSYHFKKGDVAVTFLDTPGHEAFTALRARGAQLTDVVVLVVAADDGVMPQTIEAINHAKAADVPIVVALNKIDLGTQNVTKIYGQLTEHGLTPSGDWGGDVDVIHTSATTGEGIDTLLEHLSTLAELHDYQADPTVPATGTVVEAESRQGVGPVLQVIVREGTVKVGSAVVCGNSYGKVRAIHDDAGKNVRKIGPAMPAELWGMNDVPSSGDHFFEVENMQRAKEIAEEVRDRRRSDARSSIKKARSLDDLVKQQSDADTSELNVIVKGDVDGSVDVLSHSLTQFPSDEVKLNVLHSGIGAVTDSDVQLADASNAIIVAFRVTASATTRRLAEEKGVDIRHYKVIYDVTDDIKKALEGLLTPDEVIEMRGTIEVREVFRITKVGLVAGSYVRDGSVSANYLSRVVRDGVVVRDNCKFNSLRRFKDDVKEVRNGMECGVRLEGFDDIKVGDIIETFEVIKVARTLD